PAQELRVERLLPVARVDSDAYGRCRRIKSTPQDLPFGVEHAHLVPRSGLPADAVYGLRKYPGVSRPDRAHPTCLQYDVCHRAPHRPEPRGMARPAWVATFASA